METEKNLETKKGVVRITYKLLKKVDDLKISKQSTGVQKSTYKKAVAPTKVTEPEDDDDDDDDDDDLPLIKMNLKLKSKKSSSSKICNVQPQKAADKQKKNLLGSDDQQAMDSDVTLKKEEDPPVKVKPAYCKICFIKMRNDKEALEHERCHDTFRNANGKWTCIICADQFPFYCDLLNHFLNHRDILELYSVYLSNLDTSLGVKKQEACSDDDSEDFELELKDEIDDFNLDDETKDESNTAAENKSKNNVDKVDHSKDKNINICDVIITESAKPDAVKDDTDDFVVPKTEPVDEVYCQDEGEPVFGRYDDPDPASFFRDTGEALKLEAEGFTVKKELLEDNTGENVYLVEGDNAMYDDGFHDDDSDEDKPLSSCVVKKTKKKKKKKVEKENVDGVAKKEKVKKKLKKVKLSENEECLSDEQTVRKPKKPRSSDDRQKIPYSKFYRMQKCEECDFETSKKADMETHSALHVEGEPILCELCDFRCKIERQLLRHKRLAHEGYKFACDSCDFTSKTIANLRGHMVVHGDRKIGCNICGKMFRRKNNLNDHLKTHTDERPYKCSECTKTFKDPKGYKMHLLGAHNIIQRLSCSYCDFETDHREELNMHKASLHHSLYMRLAPGLNEKGEMVDLIIYACNMCEYVANTEANLKSHLIVHDEKRISCEVCGKLFRRLGNLLEHQRSHSENRPFVCPVCPAKAFKDNKSYRRHIARQHDMIEMIKCDICDYKTHTKGLMRFHAMKHSGQLRFKCNECSYACMTRNTMQRHKLVHKDVLPVFNCELCDFQSVSDRAVKRHKQVHAEK